jgi:hypothetical protein
VPTTADEVVVNHAVALDIHATVFSLTVNSTLTFDNNSMTNHTLIVLGNVTINSGGAINLSPSGPQRTHAFVISGDFTNAGTFAGVSGRGNRVLNTTFNGTGRQAISGSGTTNFNDLTISHGAHVVFPASNVPTVEGTLTVNIGGAVQQTRSVDSGPVVFLQIGNSTANAVKYRGVELTPSISALGSTTVVITTTTSGGCTTPDYPSNYVTRCYSITPANNVAATVRLWALAASQLNGIHQANLRLYRYADGWQQLTANASVGSDGGSYVHAQADTPGFSTFLLGAEAPTALTLTAFQAQPQTATWPLPIGLLLVLGAILFLIRRRT